MHVQHLVIDEVLPPRLDALLRRQFGIQTAGISPPAVSFKTVSPAMTQQLIFVVVHCSRSHAPKLGCIKIISDAVECTEKLRNLEGHLRI